MFPGTLSCTACSVAQLGASALLAVSPLAGLSLLLPPAEHPHSPDPLSLLPLEGVAPALVMRLVAMVLAFHALYTLVWLWWGPQQGRGAVMLSLALRGVVLPLLVGVVMPNPRPLVLLLLGSATWTLGEVVWGVSKRQNGDHDHDHDHEE